MYLLVDEVLLYVLFYFEIRLFLIFLAKVWQFRYNHKHLLPKFECREGYSADMEFTILAAEQKSGAIQRIFVTSGYDVLV